MPGRLNGGGGELEGGGIALASIDVGLGSVGGLGEQQPAASSSSPLSSPSTPGGLLSLLGSSRGGPAAHVFSPATNTSGGPGTEHTDDEHGDTDGEGGTKESSRSNPPSGSRNMIAIVGRTADPFAKEDWAADFDLDGPEDDDKPPVLMRAATTMNMTLGGGGKVGLLGANSPSNETLLAGRQTASDEPLALVPTTNPSQANVSDGFSDSDLSDFDVDEGSELRLPLTQASIDANLDLPSPESRQRHLDLQAAFASAADDAPTEDEAASDAGSDAFSEEDWDEEIRAEEVAEAAAKGFSDEQISQLLTNQSTAVSNDHAKRSTLLAGFSIADGGAARSPSPIPVRRIPVVTNGLTSSVGGTTNALAVPSSHTGSPNLPARRTLKPTPQEDEEGPSAAAAADAQPRKSKKSSATRGPGYAFTPSLSQQIVSTVSHGDPLLSPEYTLHSTLSLQHILSQHELTSSLLQSAAAASTSAHALGKAQAHAPRLRDGQALPAAPTRKINIVMYPTPSQLHSLKTPEGLSGYTEKQLEAWLKTLVAKHAQAWRMKSVPLEPERERPAILTTTHQVQQLLAASLFRINHLYRASVTLDQYRQAKTAHLGINGAGRHLSFASPPSSPMSPTGFGPQSSSSSTPPLSSSSSSEPAAQAWTLLVNIMTTVLDPSSPICAPLANDVAAWRYTYGLLFVGAKLWRPSVATTFGDLITRAQKVFPIQAGFFQLLELETLAHHDPTKANRLMRIFASLYKRHSPAAALPVANGAPSNVAAEVCAQALVSLHLYLGNLSPLTTAPLSDAASWDGRDDGQGFDWLDHAWAGEKPPPPAGLVGPNAAYELEALTWELCGPPDHRMSLLKELYPRLAVSSFGKARAAYAIGHYTATIGAAGGALAAPPSSAAAAAAVGGATGPFASSSVGPGGVVVAEHPTRAAERWIMEALYVLDQMGPFPTATAPGALAAANATAAAAAAAASSDTTSSLPAPVALLPPAHDGIPRSVSARPHSASSATNSAPSSGSNSASSTLQASPTSCLGLAVNPMLSELACNALILYGDILLALDKYKYAILAFESAQLNHQYRRSTDFHSLSRRLVDIAAKEEDHERNVQFHAKIRDKAQADGQLNMYVYIVQQLSKLEVAGGSFRRAEEHLRDALHFLRPFAQQSSGIMPGAAHARRSASGSMDFSAAGASFSPTGGAPTSPVPLTIPTTAASTSSLTPPLQQPPLAGLAFWDLRLEIQARFAMHPAREFRSAVLQIFLQLARLYLDGDRIDSAISVLEMIMSSGRDGSHAAFGGVSDRQATMSMSSGSTGSGMSHGSGPSASPEGLSRSKLNQVYLLLATAYAAKKRYSKADSLLKQMEELNGVGAPQVPEQPTRHHARSSTGARTRTRAMLRPTRGGGGSIGGHGAGGSGVFPPLSPAPTSSPGSSGSGSGSFAGGHPLSLVLDPGLYNDFLVLRSKIALCSRDFRGALYFVTLSFSAINPSSNLGAMARLTLRRGRIWQRVAEEAMHGHAGKQGYSSTSLADLEQAGLLIRADLAAAAAASAAAAPSATPTPPAKNAHLSLPGGGSGSVGRHQTAASFSGAFASPPPPITTPAMKYLQVDGSLGHTGPLGLVLCDPSLPLQSLYDSYNYFSLVDDAAHQATALSQIVDTYLTIVFVPVAVHDLPLASPTMREWLTMAGFDAAGAQAPTAGPGPFDAFLRTLEELCVEVVESSRSSLHLLGMLQAYAHLMELKFLQGRWRESTAFFLELKYAIIELFVHPPPPRAGQGASVSNGRSGSVAGVGGSSADIAVPAVPAVPTSTFNALVGKTSPAFLRGLYHTLKRLARIIAAYQLAEVDSALLPATSVHGRMDSSTVLPGLLSQRFFVVDPTLSAVETQRFVRDHLDMPELFQAFVGEVYGEEAETPASATTHAREAKGDADPPRLASQPAVPSSTVHQAPSADLASRKAQRRPSTIKTKPTQAEPVPTTDAATQSSSCCSNCAIM